MKRGVKTISLRKEKIMKLNKVNQGQLCLLVIQNLVNATPSKTISVADAIHAMRCAGWKTNLDTLAQQRKFIYEVFRQARRDELTSIRVDGDVIFLEEEEDSGIEKMLNDISRVSRAELTDPGCSDVKAIRIPPYAQYVYDEDILETMMSALGFERQRFHRLEAAFEPSVREEMLQEELNGVVKSLIDGASAIVEGELEKFKTAGAVTCKVFAKLYDLSPSMLHDRKKSAISLDMVMYVKTLAYEVQKTL